MNIEFVKEINDNAGWGFENTITVKVNNEDAGYIAIEANNDNDGRIEYIEIFEDFRGKGFYNMLLISAFTMFDLCNLYSDDRNEESNPIYQYWTNNNNLQYNDTVRISIDGEKVLFNA